MENGRRIKSGKTRVKRKTEEQEVIEILLAEGAVEIPISEWNKEPYKSLMKNIKQNNKFICD